MKLTAEKTIYKKEAIKDGMTEASKKATNYLAVDSTGIMVANLDGSTETPSTATTRNVFIDNDSVDIRDGADVLASFGEMTTIGEEANGKIRLEIDSDSFEIIRHTDSDIVMAHIGYGETRGQNNVVENAPYFTFGRRDSTRYGSYSIAEGFRVIASSAFAHAEGIQTTASGEASHAEGASTVASTLYCHAEGHSTTASGYSSHAEGNRSTASGDYSHAQNYYTIAARSGQTAIGTYNIEDPEPSTAFHPNRSKSFGTYALIVGNGTSDSDRSNACTVDWKGNTSIAGTLTQSSDKRLKKHISYLDDDAIDFINNLEPAFFEKDGEKHIGFYAQDVEECDHWGCMTGEMNNYKTLNYIEIIAPLVKYCQKLEKRISELENKAVE